MPSKAPLGRAELLALTGLPNQTMTFWLREDLVEPIGKRSGKGVHLKFSYYEANIVAVLYSLKLSGANIDALRGVAGIYRKAIAWAQDRDLSFDEALALSLVVSKVTTANPLSANFDSSKLFSREEFFLYESKIRAGSNLVDRLREVVDFENIESNYQIFTFVEIAIQPLRYKAAYPTYFWPTAQGWKRGNGQAGQNEASRDGAFTSIAVDVFGLLYRVWNRQASDEVHSLPLIDLEPAR